MSIKACLDEQTRTTQSSLKEIFMQYGLPKRINVDNGNPWGSKFYQCRYTTFSLWLIDHGIEVSYSRPHHPQTNGKNERFNRSLLNEAIENKYIKDILDAQAQFDKWRHVYNFERPHEALDNQVPSDRYKPSYRSFKEDKREFIYSSEFTTKRTSARGIINIDGRQIFIGVPFAKREIGLQQISAETSACLEIYYRNQRLGSLSLDEVEKDVVMNLYADL